MNFKIFQVKNGAEYRDYRYIRLDELKKYKLKLSMSNYNKVYDGYISDGVNDLKILEELFYTFNMDHPADYEGRSMSVSDIVQLNDKYYYCDSIGFKEVIL